MCENPVDNAAIAHFKLLAPANVCLEYPGQTVFQKTLAFFCVLQLKGCPFDNALDADSSLQLVDTGNFPGEIQNEPVDCVPGVDGKNSSSRQRTKGTTECKGKLQLIQSDDHSPVVQYVFHSPEMLQSLIYD